MKKTVGTLGLLVFLGVIVWVGIGFSDLPEEQKRALREWIARALLGLLTVGLVLAATASLPAATLWWAAGAAAVATAVAPGTCFQVIDGTLCLGSNCLEEGA